MGLSQPPAYEYSPITPTTSESAGSEDGTPLNEIMSPEYREFSLQCLREKHKAERKRLALRQAYIWAMTATIGGTILGIMYIGMRYG